MSLCRGGVPDEGPYREPGGGVPQPARHNGPARASLNWKGGGSRD